MICRSACSPLRPRSSRAWRGRSTPWPEELEEGQGRLREQAAELRRSEMFLDSVLEHVPSLLSVKDARELRFVRFNRAGEELAGYSRHELIGKDSYDIVPKAEADVFTAQDRAALAAGVPLDIEAEPMRTREHGLRYVPHDEDSCARRARCTSVPAGDLRRHHRTAAGRSAAARCEGAGGASQRGQERLPLADEPRIAHPPELDPWLWPAARNGRAVRAAARTCPLHPRIGAPPAAADQRGARHDARGGRRSQHLPRARRRGPAAA